MTEELLFKAWQPIRCANGHLVFLATAPQLKFKPASLEKWSATRAKLIPIGDNLRDKYTWICKCGAATFLTTKGLSSELAFKAGGS